MSVPFAILFPGQGAQYVGMGRDFYERHATARVLFDEADGMLGFSLSKLCFEGPEEELTRTENSQPAIFVTSLAIWAALKEVFPTAQPVLTCGLSLGEFSALVAAKVLPFAEALVLVRKRGEFMEQAGKKQPGTMASIIGLEEAACEAIAAECKVSISNYNSPEQVVFSGVAPNIERAVAMAKERGAQKAIPLQVSGAFHSPLMKDASDKLLGELKKIKFEKPESDYISNVTADFEKSPEKIQELLVRQLTSPVRWRETIQTIWNRGVEKALEVGPGKVLRGLVRRTEARLEVANVDQEKEIGSFRTLIGGGRTSSV